MTWIPLGSALARVLENAANEMRKADGLPPVSITKERRRADRQWRDLTDEDLGPKPFVLERRRLQPRRPRHGSS